MVAHLLERIAARSVRADLGHETACKIHTGAPRNGYGQIGVGSRTDGTAQTLYIHRVIWEHHHGPIPEDMEIDHLCHPDDGSCPGGTSCPHRACHEISHLSLKTGRDNTLRGTSPAARHARQTHCINGHPLSGDNLYEKRRPSGRARRECRECAAASRLRWRREHQ